jgi:2-methylcitrate dehydratase PrpD
VSITPGATAFTVMPRGANSSAEQICHALGIAAPLGGGYRENFGTMTKPLHAGQAAEAGVFAARLAADGFTAATNILEAKRSLYCASSDGFEPSRIEGRLGKPFFLEDHGISIKPYPSGRCLIRGRTRCWSLCASTMCIPRT